MKLFIRTLVKLLISPAVLVGATIAFCLALIQILVVGSLNLFAWVFDLEKPPTEEPLHFYTGRAMIHFLVSDFVAKKYATYDEYLDSLPKSASRNGET